MTTWIQSLSWTLIYSLGQGFAVYAMLWLAFRLVPVKSANARYHLSLSALTVLLGWFAATWWQQYHLISASEQSMTAITATNGGAWMPMQRISLSTGVNVSTIESSLRAMFPWLSAFYVTGLALMVTRLSAGMLQLFSLRNSGTNEPDNDVSELFKAQKEKMHVNTTVRLLVSAKAQVPMVIGFIKPVVLLPVAALTQLDPEQLKTILLHELAHIRRHDYLVNILQTLVETILFFNPFVWVISKIARQERELCCDDLVVGNTAEPLFYATALATLASRKNVAPSMAVAASGQSTHLYDRIQRIMEVRKHQFSYSRMVATVIILASITCSVAWIRPSFTGKKSKGTVTTTSKTTANNNTAEETATSNGATSFKDKEKKKTGAGTKEPAAKEVPEQNILIQRLLDDKKIDQVRGFLVEKRDNKLFINGEQQPDAVANKYLEGLKSKTMYMQVYRLEDRLRMHPNADLLQLLLPYTLESPCVDVRPKEGC